MRLDLSGINPAHLVPFHEETQEIHEEGLEDHFRYLASVDGVNGIVCNGHAAEVHALTEQEQDEIVDMASSVLDRETPIVSGVVGGSTPEVVERAERVKANGADAILVLPPHTQINGDRRTAEQFFRRLGAVDIPVVLFQHPIWAGGTFEPELLGTLVELENIIAVKEAVWDITRFQDDISAIRSAEADVQILVADDEHLLPCYSLAGDGSILGLAAAIPELVVALFRAVQENDLDRARTVYDRMLPFVKATYGTEPKLAGHTRLKAALELQGRFPTSIPREPSLPLSSEEVAELRTVMGSVDLLE